MAIANYTRLIIRKTKFIWGGPKAHFGLINRVVNYWHIAGNVVSQSHLSLTAGYNGCAHNGRYRRVLRRAGPRPGRLMVEPDRVEPGAAIYELRRSGITESGKP